MLMKAEEQPRTDYSDAQDELAHLPGDVLGIREDDPEAIRLGDVVPSIFSNDERLIYTPSNVFHPEEEWSGVTRTGILKAIEHFRLNGEHIIEVGSGTGIHGITLSHLVDLLRLTAIEVSHDVLNVSEINFIENIPRGVRTKIDFYLSDLLSDVEVGNARFLFACIPQMKIPEGLKIEEGDNFANYCLEDKESIFDCYGLGLNDRLLRQAHEKLPEGAMVGLTLAGRPSIAQLNKMFLINGFIPKIIHAEIIPQDPTTSLLEMVNVEQQTGAFEFFADPQARIAITAAQAEERRLSKQPLYHKLYFIVGIKT